MFHHCFLWFPADSELNGHHLRTPWHLGGHAAEPGAVTAQPLLALHQQHLGAEARRGLGCREAAGAGTHHLGEAMAEIAWGGGDFNGEYLLIVIVRLIYSILSYFTIFIVINHSDR